MTDLQKVKISISILIALGVAKSQKEIGAKLGYESESAFSQIINGKVSINDRFIKKLRNLHKEVDNFWRNGFGGSAENMVSSEDYRKLEIENSKLKDLVIKLQQLALDKSLSPDKNIVDDKL